MSYLEYKGHLGTVEFSADDRVFYGKIHGINDLVTFEAVDVDTLLSAFQEAVDDYLDLCHRYGKEPEKAYSGQFNVRLDSSLHKKLSQEAAKDGVTLNQYVTQALASYCAEPTQNYKSKGK
ncbi:MAG: type II toxin-antitoxin system HicB family antitoxin [Oscillospiraceae bacterium]|nr:type II toxin-antitoxin system HicB family antitoxin [Oscillospiraceae bacterium]